MATRTCAHCGKSLAGKRIDAVYHAEACRSRARRRRAAGLPPDTVGHSAVGLREVAAFERKAFEEGRVEASLLSAVEALHFAARRLGAGPIESELASRQDTARSDEGDKLDRGGDAG
jgi:hypothetical protein